MTENVFPPVQAAIDSLKQQKWPDGRTTVCAAQALAEGDTVRLVGEVLEQAQREEVERAARDEAPHAHIVDELVVLSRPDTPWALVRASTSNLRRSGSNKSELLAQGLYGEPVEILKTDEQGWCCVRLSDGYLGWTVDSYLSRCSKAEAQDYRARADALVLAELAQAYAGPETLPRLLVGRLPFGVPVHAAERRNGMARVNWEGEPPLWVAERDLLPIAERPRPDPAGIARALDLMSRFLGIPYLWGGESPFGFDCSGYAQTMMEFLGVCVPRDADLQCYAGRPVDGEPRPGDLLLFGSKRADGAEPEHIDSISHVAISLGGTEFIHATQVAWGVQRNSFDPASPIFAARLKERLVAVRRFL